jgi:N-methylhydantoinase A
VRYFGEGHEVQVEIPEEREGEAAVAHMWKEFHRVHDRTFGFHYEGDQDVELVNLRVQAIGIQHRPEVKEADGQSEAGRPFGRRRVFWRQTGWVESPLYRRTDLAVGQRVEGPAIVEEYGSTVVVPQDWGLSPDRFGNLIMEKSA